MEVIKKLSPMGHKYSIPPLATTGVFSAWEPLFDACQMYQAIDGG